MKSARAFQQPMLLGAAVLHYRPPYVRAIRRNPPRECRPTRKRARSELSHQPNERATDPAYGLASSPVPNLMLGAERSQPAVGRIAAGANKRAAVPALVPAGSIPCGGGKEPRNRRAGISLFAPRARFERVTSRHTRSGRVCLLWQQRQHDSLPTRQRDGLRRLSQLVAAAEPARCGG